MYPYENFQVRVDCVMEVPLKWLVIDRMVEYRSESLLAMAQSCMEGLQGALGFFQ